VQNSALNVRTRDGVGFRGSSARKEKRTCHASQTTDARGRVLFGSGLAGRVRRCRRGRATSVAAPSRGKRGSCQSQRPNPRVASHVREAWRARERRQPRPRRRARQQLAVGGWTPGGEGEGEGDAPRPGRPPVGGSSPAQPGRERDDAAGHHDVVGAGRRTQATKAKGTPPPSARSLILKRRPRLPPLTRAWAAAGLGLDDLSSIAPR
jgi:hypothetical protein